jgi:peptidoglycan lytic transglycosylase
MRTAAVSRRRSRAHPTFRRRRRSPRARARRRRLLLVLALLLGATAALLIGGLGPINKAVRELTLPLRHEDIIRQQAKRKHLDPALIAAIIYEESKFRDQTSHAGARGLMQITPATARFIAHDSGGVLFEQRDLATPQVNIAYGSYYLRYLMRRYDGNDELAIAAYNAGETNVDRWVKKAGGADRFEGVENIPFPETRAYVKGVVQRRKDYKERYGSQLGL